MTAKLDSSTPIQPTVWKDRVLASVAALPLAVGIIWASPGDVLANDVLSSATLHVTNVYGQQGKMGLSLTKKVDGTGMNGNVAIPNLPLGFEYRDEHAISRFLRENPFLVDVLRDAPAHIAASFGKDSSVALAVFSNPDEPTADQLFLHIRVRMSVDESIERLDHLYDEWWLDVLPTMRHKMAIAIAPA